MLSELHWIIFGLLKALTEQSIQPSLQKTNRLREVIWIGQKLNRNLKRVKMQHAWPKFTVVLQRFHIDGSFVIYNQSFWLICVIINLQNESENVRLQWFNWRCPSIKYCLILNCYLGKKTSNMKNSFDQFHFWFQFFGHELKFILSFILPLPSSLSLSLSPTQTHPHPHTVTAM